MRSPPFPRYLVPPRSKYSPQHHVLKHSQLPFLRQCQRPSFTPIQNNRQNYSSIYPNNNNNNNNNAVTACSFSILCTDFPFARPTQKLHQACCEGCERPSWKCLAEPNTQSDPRLRDKQGAWVRCSETVGPASLFAPGLHHATHCCHNKERLFPYPTLIIWSLLWIENGFVVR